MSECELVLAHWGCEAEDRTVEDGVQRGTPTLEPCLQHAEGIRGSVL